jgi:hypothetical protein
MQVLLAINQKVTESFSNRCLKCTSDIMESVILVDGFYRYYLFKTLCVPCRILVCIGDCIGMLRFVICPKPCEGNYCLTMEEGAVHTEGCCTAYVFDVCDPVEHMVEDPGCGVLCGNLGLPILCNILIFIVYAILLLVFLIFALCR